MRRVGLASAFTLLAVAAAVLAPASIEAASASSFTTLDRTVARFSDPEAVDASAGARFVMMRELILEAWLLAYERSPGARPGGFDDKELRAALERHVIEEVLSQRLPSATAEARLAAEVPDTRAVQAIAVGGDEQLAGALRDANGRATGGALELQAILQRRARAQLYLELTVAQPVELNEAELRAAYVKAPDVLAKRPFDEATPGLRSYLRAQRLREAAQAYYQAVRTRLRLEVVSD